MERYQIILAYDGTEFLGSQRQTSAIGGSSSRSRTVQSELEKTLGQLGWEGRSVNLAGRTDTGTHAAGQVAAFDLEWAHSPEELVSALNARLPLDMAVRAARVVPGDFHPRYDATSRSYRYRLFCQNTRDPLRERYSWRIWPAVEDMTSLAKIWPGVHDFAAYGTPPRRDGSSMRTVMEAGWSREGSEWIFDIRADAFLYRMVRRLVFLQVACGQGRITAQMLVDRLTSPSESTVRLPAGLAPACGLTLMEVRYDNLV